MVVTVTSRRAAGLVTSSAQAAVSPNSFSQSAARQKALVGVRAAGATNNKTGSMRSVVRQQQDVAPLSVAEENAARIKRHQGFAMSSGLSGAGLGFMGVLNAGVLTKVLHRTLTPGQVLQTALAVDHLQAGIRSMVTGKAITPLSTQFIRQIGGAVGTVNPDLGKSISNYGAILAPLILGVSIGRTTRNLVPDVFSKIYYKREFPTLLGRVGLSNKKLYRVGYKNEAIEGVAYNSKIKWLMKPTGPKSPNNLSLTGLGLVKMVGMYAALPWTAWVAPTALAFVGASQGYDNSIVWNNPTNPDGSLKNPPVTTTTQVGS